MQITDADELAEYRLQKRKGFEDTIRRMRWSAGAWTKYAKWEENQGDIARAASIYERALDEDYHSVTMWCALRPPLLPCVQQQRIPSASKPVHTAVPQRLLRVEFPILHARR